MDKRQELSKYIPHIIISITIIWLSIFLLYSEWNHKIGDIEEEEDIVTHLDIQNVGDIALTSIPDVTIQTYQDDEYAQARYIKDNKQVLDLYQCTSLHSLMTGQDYTEEFEKALTTYFDYPEGTKIDGEANFSTKCAVYILDEDDGRTIVGLFQANAPKYILFEIEKFPIDESIKYTLNEDIKSYTSFTIDFDYDDFQNMKKVYIVSQEKEGT